MNLNSIFRYLRTRLSVMLSKCKTFLISHSSNVSIGGGSVVYWKSPVDIRKGCKLTVGSGSEVGRTKHGYHCGMPFPTTLLLDCDASSIMIGDNCRINGAYIHAKKRIRIGDNCVIAAGVNIIDSNGHVLNSDNRTIGRDEPNAIYIGNNVWIGMNCIILKGTVIPDNCVVSAGSVVKGVFKENSLISGNPAVMKKQIQLTSYENSNIQQKE